MKEVFPFEEKVIELILNTIKDNQQYLTKKENLPQLAKLGYMYNTLWYAGRVSWGSDGILLPDDVMTYEKSEKVKGGVKDEDIYFGQCEDNPKYKIEMCEPENDEIENFIYDAWGMHVSNDGNESWEVFSKIVLKGKEYTEFDKKLRKIAKTFDEWVEVLTDENYKYSSIYPDRRSVANHLLCVIGNGYGYNKEGGYVISEASGADQDIDLYGDWENCIFREDIKKIVEEIMATPEVKQTVDASYNFIKEIKDKRKAKEEEAERKDFNGMTYEEFSKSEKFKAIEKMFGERKKKHHPYYPISNYSIISMFDENTHPSYVKAGVEICEEILAHSKEEKENNHGHDNTKFAEEFLKKFNK